MINLKRKAKPKSETQQKPNWLFFFGLTQNINTKTSTILLAEKNYIISLHLKRKQAEQLCLLKAKSTINIGPTILCG